MRRRHRGAFGLALVVPLVLAACASSGRSRASGSPAPAAARLPDTTTGAYGTPRTGRGRSERISRVTPQDLQHAGDVDLVSFIQTRFAGVRISGSRGDYKVFITGASFQSGVGALVLIDGTEGQLAGLRTPDVSAIEVLKDAAAVVYGVRGANGVLLITTKKK